MSGRPDVCLSVFTTTYDILRIFAKTCADLATRILIALKLHLQSLVSEIVNADSRIVAGDEDLDFSILIVRGKGDGLDACNLTAFRVFPVGGSDMDLSLVFEPLRLVEQTESVETACNNRLAVRSEGDGCYEIRQLVPIGHAFVWDAPQT